MTTIDRGVVQQWIDAYERAWRSAGSEPLAALFSDDATYSMQPYDEPARGLAAIAELWQRERDGPDERFTMTHAIVAVEGDTGVARIEVHYPDKRLDFRDLWVMRFADDRRCSAFEEWPFRPTKGSSRNDDG